MAPRAPLATLDRPMNRKMCWSFWLWTQTSCATSRSSLWNRSMATMKVWIRLCWGVNPTFCTLGWKAWREVQRPCWRPWPRCCQNLYALHAACPFLQSGSVGPGPFSPHQLRAVWVYLLCQLGCYMPRGVFWEPGLDDGFELSLYHFGYVTMWLIFRSDDSSSDDWWNLFCTDLMVCILLLVISY